MKVFISSVMEGFETERDAARRAVVAMDMIPVMAEDFPAQARASKTACITGAVEADIYLGIFGERYGWAPPGGEAVTVQEYRAAAAAGKTILIIRKKLKPQEREPRLTEFLKELGDYEEGYFFGTYANVAQLGPEIAKALKRYVVPGVPAAAGPAPASVIREYAGDDRGRVQEPTLIVAAHPLDRLPRVDTRSLGAPDLPGRLMQAARYLAPVFDEEKGAHDDEGPEHVEVYQGEEYRRTNVVRVDADRRILVVRKFPEHQGADRWSRHLESMLLDEAQVAAASEAAVSLTGLIYADKALAPAPQRWSLQAGLAGMGNRLLGRRGNHPVERLSISGMSGDDPTIVPGSPLVVTTPDAKDPRDIADRLRDGFVRAFRARGAYYAPSPGR